VAEIAELLRVSTMTVYRMVNSGELKSVRIGRAIRVRENALRDILVLPESEDLTAWMTSSPEFRAAREPEGTDSKCG
jgi:excisionase family DNA binding protein